MNCITPDKRKDGRSSFQKLLTYMCVRESAAENTAAPDVTDVPANSTRQSVIDTAFDSLTFAGTDQDTGSVPEPLPDGRHRVVCGDVICETNCFSLDTAAFEMDMVAAESRRCKDAVYHYILSWREEDKPEDSDIFTCVQESLKKLNMEGHQYVAAIHRDTDNVHVHICVNRVNPVTFLSVSLWNNYDHLQQCCREMERRFGYSVDNGSWHYGVHDELVRTPREMRTAPRGARAREIFSDRESLHGYAVRETREKINDYVEQDCLDWARLHNVLYTRGLGLREQNGGLVVFDLLHPDSVCVKASDIHPGMSYPAMTSRWGEFEKAPPVYNPDRLEDGMLGMFNNPMPQLHVRDQMLRQERREARAIARDILRARYDAYRQGWEKPDLRVKARYQQITAHCIAVKAHVRKSVRDPQLRKLMFRVAEFEKMKAMAGLRLQLREERRELSESGASRPLSWKRWVEQEALNGNVAALSQMRGWTYREKRKAKQNEAARLQPNAVVVYGPADDAPVFTSSEHECRLHRDGTVSYLRNGLPAVTDFGDRVEVYPASDEKADRFNNDLAAALTAWRSGDEVVVVGEPTAVNRVLYSGVMHNLHEVSAPRFAVTDRQQQANVRATEQYYRQVQEPDVNTRYRAENYIDERVQVTPKNNTPRH